MKRAQEGVTMVVVLILLTVMLLGGMALARMTEAPDPIFAFSSDFVDELTKRSPMLATLAGVPGATLRPRLSTTSLGTAPSCLTRLRASNALVSPNVSPVSRLAAALSAAATVVAAARALQSGVW